MNHTIKNAIIVNKLPFNEMTSITKQHFKEYNLERIDGPQKLICNAPFNSIYINISGDVTVCGYNKTFVLGNLKSSSLKEIWNNQKHHELQQHIQAYNLEYGCQVCKHKIINKDYHRAAIYYDTPKYDNTNHLRKITFELSNLCNLECIMCNGELSSLIRKNRDKKEPLQLNDYSNLTADLTTFIPHLTFTQFLGGEPLLIKIYYEIWKKIIELNSDCIISLQTNGMVLPEKFTNLLTSKQFMIGVSIDSFEKDKFESIRINTKFETVFDNFYKLLEYKKNNVIQLSINFVPMNINWMEIPTALDFANKHNVTLSMCELDFPYEYSFKSLNSTELLFIIQTLEKYNIHEYRNSVYIQNKKTYLNQISLLKNLYSNVITTEKLFPISEGYLSNHSNQIAEQFKYSLNIFPLQNPILEPIVQADFISKLDLHHPLIKTKAFQYFNQYIELSKTYYQNQDKELNPNLASILQSELSNVFETILKKIISNG